jgi:hypothetical protein
LLPPNNHYAGFDPGTVNIFRQLIGLEEAKWGDEFVTNDLDGRKDKIITSRRVIKTKQTSLSDFFQ